MHSIRLISRTRPSACVVLHARSSTTEPLTVDTHVAVVLFVDAHVIVLFVDAHVVILFISHSFTQ
jgi:hypothetical protein